MKCFMFICFKTKRNVVTQGSKSIKNVVLRLSWAGCCPPDSYTRRVWCHIPPSLTTTVLWASPGPSSIARSCFDDSFSSRNQESQTESAFLSQLAGLFSGFLLLNNYNLTSSARSNNLLSVFSSLINGFIQKCMDRYNNYILLVNLVSGKERLHIGVSTFRKNKTGFWS